MQRLELVGLSRPGPDGSQEDVARRAKPGTGSQFDKPFEIASQQDVGGASPLDGFAPSEASLDLNARYEAVLDIAASLRGRSNVAEFGAVLARTWRMCANVHSWCVLSIDDGGLNAVVSDGARQEVRSVASADLPESADALWRCEQPTEWPHVAFLTRYPDLSPWFGDAGRSDVIAFPRDRRGHRFVIVVASGPGGFQRLDYKFIDAVAAMFISEVVNLRSIGKLTRALDGQPNPLTSVVTRRQFLSMLERYWSDAERRKNPLALLMLEIDEIKHYNEHYGHPAGDACIRATAAEMVAALNRPVDVVGRSGGAKFAFLLPGMSEHGAGLVAQQIIAAIEARNIPNAASTISDRVTVSVGAAMRVPRPGQDATLLVEAADDALFEAKRTGRRGVVCEGAHTAAVAAAVAAVQELQGQAAAANLVDPGAVPGAGSATDPAGRTGAGQSAPQMAPDAGPRLAPRGPLKG